MRSIRAPEGAAAEFARMPPPSPATGWRAAGWCAVDLELTGLNPRRDEIISIGAIPIDDGRVILGRGMYTLVRTTRRSERGAVLVHKLRVPDLTEAPPIGDALDLVFGVLAGRVPVFHTAAVERAFLSKLFRRRRLRLPRAADTEQLGRLWLLGRNGSAPPSLPLARLSSALGIAPEAPHHALGDALTTAQVFVALARHLDANEPQTVGSLLGAGERMAPARRFG